MSLEPIGSRRESTIQSQCIAVGTRPKQKHVDRMNPDLRRDERVDKGGVQQGREIQEVPGPEMIALCDMSSICGCCKVGSKKPQAIFEDSMTAVFCIRAETVI
jgi:hypothetical protein